jgi:hypothetical protein
MCHRWELTGAKLVGAGLRCRWWFILVACPFFHKDELIGWYVFREIACMYPSKIAFALDEVEVP